MSGQEKTVPSLPVANAILATDTLVSVVANSSGNSVTSLVPVGIVPTVNVSIGTPANSTASTIGQGRTWTDGNYLYVATANNTVKRVALSAF